MVATAAIIGIIVPSPDGITEATATTAAIEMTEATEETAQTEMTGERETAGGRETVVTDVLRQAETAEPKEIETDSVREIGTADPSRAAEQIVREQSGHRISQSWRPSPAAASRKNWPITIKSGISSLSWKTAALQERRISRRFRSVPWKNRPSRRSITGQSRL
jgi:hypothetical protein